MWWLVSINLVVSIVFIILLVLLHFRNEDVAMDVSVLQHNNELLTKMVDTLHENINTLHKNDKTILSILRKSSYGKKKSEKINLKE